MLAQSAHLQHPKHPYSLDDETLHQAVDLSAKGEICPQKQTGSAVDYLRDLLDRDLSSHISQDFAFPFKNLLSSHSLHASLPPHFPPSHPPLSHSQSIQSYFLTWSAKQNSYFSAPTSVTTDRTSQNLLLSCRLRKPSSQIGSYAIQRTLYGGVKIISCIISKIVPKRLNYLYPTSVDQCSLHQKCRL